MTDVERSPSRPPLGWIAVEATRLSAASMGVLVAALVLAFYAVGVVSSLGDSRFGWAAVSLLLALAAPGASVAAWRRAAGKHEGRLDRFVAAGLVALVVSLLAFAAAMPLILLGA